MTLLDPEFVPFVKKNGPCNKKQCKKPRECTSDLDIQMCLFGEAAEPELVCKCAQRLDEQ
jgi:hypothetical protein